MSSSRLPTNRYQVGKRPMPGLITAWSRSNPFERKPMKPKCSICGGEDEVASCGPGHVCGECAEKTRTGRDNTSRRAKLLRKALTGQAAIARLEDRGTVASDLDVFDTESASLMSLEEAPPQAITGAGGEALPKDDPALRDTMANPTTTALDASAERLRLISQVGVDAVALCLDASDTAQAGNSLERMLAHQLAVLHATAMDNMAKANLQQNPEIAVKKMNLSLRAMDVYQRGMLTLKRMKSSGEQRITIQHVDVKDGGMAAFGNLPARGAGK